MFEADFLERDELAASVGEVRNYVTAAERAYELLGQGHPITVRLLEDDRIFQCDSVLAALEY